MKREKGLKHDSGKVPMDLLPRAALEKVARVLGKGAKKYKPWNWMNVAEEPGGRERLLAAIDRHMTGYKERGETDADTGEGHMACVARNALFIIWRDLPQDVRDRMRKRIKEVRT